jgi:hypothetical protein
LIPAVSAHGMPSVFDFSRETAEIKGQTFSAFASKTLHPNN